MMTTISAWGARGLAKRAPSLFRVRVTEIRSGLDGAVARIERETGLKCCTVSPQGQSGGDNHYEVTLGIPVPRRHGGGYSVEGSIWIAVPAGTGRGQIGYR